MTRIAKLYAQVRLGRNPSFKELQQLARAFGFELERIPAAITSIDIPR